MFAWIGMDGTPSALDISKPEAFRYGVKTMAIKDNQRFRKLQGQQCYGVAPSNIEAMMTGANRAQQTKTGEVTLYYCDGTTEKATLSVDLDSLENGWFGIVSAIQSIARA